MCALFSSTFTFRLNIFVILIFHFVSFRLRMIDGFSFLHCSSIIRHTCRSKLTRSQTVEARKSQFWHTDFLSRLKSHQLWHNCVWIVHSMPLSICTQKNENKKESAIFTFFSSISRICSIRYLVNGCFEWKMRKKHFTLKLIISKGRSIDVLCLRFICRFAHCVEKRVYTVPVLTELDKP